MLVPRLVKTTGKHLVGMSVQMSFSNNLTSKLWGEFMPHRKEIANGILSPLYSLEIYPDNWDMNTPDPTHEFIKWAAIEVEKLDKVPTGMKTLFLPEGLYAVFSHRGTAVEFFNNIESIFRDWLPPSNYVVDHRPHFELLGELYKGPDNPESEEEIWVPIKIKS